MNKIFKTLLILLGLSTIYSCSTNEEALSVEPLPSSDISLYAIDTSAPKDQAQEAELILTGEHIKWFNQRTRQIKFVDFTPDAKTFPPHKKIQFKLADEVLFEANAYVNAIYSQIFTDLVIFHDIENDAYYLNDYYPAIDAIRDLEETQANIKAREENWNRFLEALKTENRLM